MSSRTFILTFTNVSSYRKYKKEIETSGGTIKNDLGETLLGFTAVMPPTLVEAIRPSSFVDSGISSFEEDSVVTIQ